MEESLKKILLPLISFFATIRYIWFALVVIVLAWFVLVETEPARDLLSSLDGTYLWILLVTSCIFSLLLWFSCRTILRLPDITRSIKGKAKPKIIEWTIDWMPRIVGVSPFIILTIAFWNIPNYNSSFLKAAPYLFFFLGLLFFLFYIKKRKFFNQEPASKKWHYDRKNGWNSLNPQEQGIIIGAVFVTIAFTAILVSLDLGLKISLILRSANILILGLSALLLYTFLLTLIDIKSELPVSLLALILFAIFSTLNSDRHELRYLKRLDQNQRLSLIEDFGNWLHLKATEDTTGSIPVFIVAAEGGGIRASQWAIHMLNELDTQYQGAFLNNTYAISSVSGGSVGATQYLAYLADKNEDGALHDFDSANNHIDLLSGVTAYLFFPEMFQRPIPFSIPIFDRGRGLEDNFSYFYKQQFKTDRLEKGFYETYLDHQDLPRLFLNSAAAETGQKVIISPVQTNFIDDAEDFYALSGKDIALKTAAMTSARFPFVTPPAIVSKNGSRCKKSLLLDGGYYENTGMETALQIIYQLREELETTRFLDPRVEKAKKRVNFILVSIKNGDTNYDEGEASTLFVDFTSPATGFFNVWSRKGLATLGNFRRHCSHSRETPIGFLSFELDRCGEEFPLSWYMSQPKWENIIKLSKEVFLKRASRNPCTTIASNYASVDVLDTLLKKNRIAQAAVEFPPNSLNR